MNLFGRTAFVVLFASFPLLMPGPSSHAFEMGPLSSVIKPGSFGHWRTSYEFGAAVLENASSKGAIRYHAVRPDTNAAGRRTITVNVSLFSNQQSARADGTLIDVKSLGKLAEAKLQARLRIEEVEGQSHLFIDGEEKAIIKLPNSKAGTGIVAAGQGRFSFKNFDIAVDGKSSAHVEIVNPVKTVKPKPPNIVKIETDDTNELGQKGMPPGTIRLQPIDVFDEWGIEKGTVKAASLLVPTEWTFKGKKVVWVSKGCLARTVQSPFEIKSPDGDVHIAKFVTQQVLWSNFQGANSTCPRVRINSAEEMMQYIISLLQFRNVKIVDRTRIPELTKLQKQFFQRDPAGSIFMDHMAFVIDYEDKGRPFRAGFFFLSNHQTISMNDGWGSRFDSVSASATPQYMSAPRDQFEKFMPVYQMIMNSYRVDPVWQAKLNQLYAKMRKQDRDTFVAINKINQQTQKEISAINQSIYETQNQSTEKGQQQFIEMIREEQTVHGKPVVENSSLVRPPILTHHLLASRRPNFSL